MITTQIFEKSNPPQSVSDIDWGVFAYMDKFHTNHPFKNYASQLRGLVENKGLIIDNPLDAVIALQHYSYYTLINGYKDLFIDPNEKNKERFKNGTTFSMLYQAHWIDMEMSNLLFKYTLLVEKKLKTRVSYTVSEKFGVKESEYLKALNYSQQKHHRGKLAQLKENIESNREKDISAIHYMNTEENLPPWITTKAISFGDTFIWFQILRREQKKNVIDDFLTPLPKMGFETLADFFKRLLGQVYKYRNLSAHGNRNFKLSIDSKYKLKKIHLQNYKLDYLFENLDDKHYSSLYSVLISIIILVDDKYAISNFIRELNIFFDKYKDFNFNDKDIFDLFEIPRETISLLISYQSTKEYRTNFKKLLGID